VNPRLEPSKNPDRSDAWGCLTANLALPGSGSLLAGRKIGYAQLVLTTAGLLLTLGSGIPAILWFLKNWEHLMSPPDDPAQRLSEIFAAIRWPLIGFGIFGFSLCWALITSLGILWTPKSPAPPKLGQ
jgi:hypothetical protein